MPLRNRYTIEDGRVYFVTTSTFKHQKFPGYPESFPIIQEILFRTGKDKDIIIMAQVLMPTHIHLILGTNEGGKAISRFMHSLKGRIRENLQGKGKFWQDGFDDLILFSLKQFYTKLNYIHNNPVKTGLIETAGDWIYSSYKNWLNGVSDGNIQIDFKWMDR